MVTAWREAPSFGSANQLISGGIRVGYPVPRNRQLTIVNCRARRPWCKAAHCRFPRKRRRNPPDDVVVCVRADDGRGDLRGSVAVGPRRAGTVRRPEAVVYTDQLQEIDRDVASGLIGKAEAEAARIEIGRRLLAVADQDAGTALKPSIPWRRAAAALALVGLPLLAVGIYLPLGRRGSATFRLRFAAALPRPRSRWKPW